MVRQINERGLVMATYEYKFVRLGENRGSAIFGVADEARKGAAYQSVIREHAREGWRLVQIFSPGTAAFGASRYFELIFERQLVEPVSPGGAETATTS